MRTAAAILGFCVALFLSQPGFAALRVVVMDVGQGQAILLRQGNHGVLIDSGMASFATQLLARIQAHGVSELDYFILTHLHPDHAGGYFRVRQRYPEAVVIGNGHPLDERRQPFIVNLYDDALKGDPNLRIMRAGDEVAWRGVTIKALWPAAYAGQNHNRHSLVLEITHGESRVLIMGDTGNYVERWLMARGAIEGPVSLLVSGHHGMARSADAAFLARVRPRVAVISANWRVPSYQPGEAVIARLEAASGRFLRTDDDGEICLELAVDSNLAEDC